MNESLILILLIGALVITGFVTVFLVLKNPRPGQPGFGPPVVSPIEAVKLDKLSDMPPAVAVLEAWIFDGLPARPEYRIRRDRIRASMPLLARCLDRLVRDWDDRYIPQTGLDPTRRPDGLRQLDRLAPVDAVVASWATARWARSPRRHRAARRDVRRAHPILARHLDRLADTPKQK